MNEAIKKTTIRVYGEEVLNAMERIEAAIEMIPDIEETPVIYVKDTSNIEIDKELLLVYNKIIHLLLSSNQLLFTRLKTKCE